MESTRDQEFDAIVVGGSFAGLAAATQLARARRSVLVVDDGKPRNRFAHHSHGFLGQDGQPPQEILRTAREQLAKYPTVRFLADRATRASRSERFSVETSVGSFRARRLVLAYGMRDLLPEIEGLDELWGTGVFHCPYCHGYEVRDRPLAVLGDGPLALHQAIMLPDWSKDVVLFTHGPSTLDEATRGRLARRGVAIEEGRIARLVADGGALVAIEMRDGRRLRREGFLPRRGWNRWHRSTAISVARWRKARWGRSSARTSGRPPPCPASWQRAISRARWAASLGRSAMARPPGR